MVLFFAGAFHAVVLVVVRHSAPSSSLHPVTFKKNDNMHYNNCLLANKDKGKLKGSSINEFFFGCAQLSVDIKKDKKKKKILTTKKTKTKA